MESMTTTTPEISSLTAFKKRVMKRIYAIWFLKNFGPLLAVELILLFGVAVGVLTHISVRNIMVNAFSSSSGIGAFIQFFIDNFFVKSIQSRLLVAVYGVLIGFFVRDIVGALRRLKHAAGDDLATLFALGETKTNRF